MDNYHRNYHRNRYLHWGTIFFVLFSMTTSQNVLTDQLKAVSDFANSMQNSGLLSQQPVQQQQQQQIRQYQQQSLKPHLPLLGSQLQQHQQQLRQFQNYDSIRNVEFAEPPTPPPIQPCTCGVFLTGQFRKGSSDPPTGNPALLHEQEKSYPCTTTGAKQCQSKCLEIIVRHLPNSAEILCASMDRDVYKERAYLFIQNCNTTWINTKLSAGREFCCKDGAPYPCPMI